MKRLALAGLAGVALVTTGTSVVWAHGGDANLVHACVKTRGGAVRIIAANGTCAKGETPLDWGQQGPQGLQGPQGERGLQGLQGIQGVPGNDGADGQDGASITLIGGGSGTVKATGNVAGGEYVALFNDSRSTVVGDVEQAVWAAGAVGNLDVRLRNTPGAGRSWTFTLVKNGVETSLTCSIANTNSICTDTNPAHAVTFAAGDLLALKSLGTNNPNDTLQRWTATFAPTSP